MGKPELPHARWSQREPRVWMKRVFSTAACCCGRNAQLLQSRFLTLQSLIMLARDHGEDGEDNKSWDGGKRHDYMLHVDNI